MVLIQRAVFAIVASVVLLGCTPRYYQFDLTSKSGTTPKLHCFDPMSMSPYMWKDLDEELFRLALIRVNRSFAGAHGMYRELFEPFTTFSKDAFHSESPKADWAKQAEMAIDLAMTPEGEAQSKKLEEFEKQGFKVNQCKRDVVPTFPAYSSIFSQPSTLEGDKKSSSASTNSTTNNINTINFAPSGEKGPKDKTSQDETKKASKPAEDMASPLVQKLQIVASTYLYSLNPANRIEKAYLLITPLDQGVQFLQVQGPSIVTPITYAKQQDFAELAMTSSGLPLGRGQGSPIALEPKVNRTITKDIIRQFTTQNVEIYPLRNTLFLSEDGGPAAADISGNRVYEVTILVPPSLCTYGRLIQEKGDAAGSPSAGTTHHSGNGPAADRDKKSSLLQGIDQSPRYCSVTDIPALVASVGIVRTVNWGKRTVEEDDDWITLVPFKTATVTNLVPPNSTTYGLEVGEGKNYRPIVFASEPGSREPLMFEDVRVAWKFHQDLLATFTSSADPNKWSAEHKIGVGYASPGESLNSELLRKAKICTFGSTVEAKEFGLRAQTDRCTKPQKMEGS